MIYSLKVILSNIELLLLIHLGNQQNKLKNNEAVIKFCNKFHRENFHRENQKLLLLYSQLKMLSPLKRSQDNDLVNLLETLPHISNFL